MTKIKKRFFICALCKGNYEADVTQDKACYEEFITCYGHTPEEAINDEVVSLCDSCYDEFNKRKKSNDKANVKYF